MKNLNQIWPVISLIFSLDNKNIHSIQPKPKALSGAKKQTHWKINPTKLLFSLSSWWNNLMIIPIKSEESCASRPLCSQYIDSYNWELVSGMTHPKKSRLFLTVLALSRSLKISLPRQLFWQSLTRLNDWIWVYNAQICCLDLLGFEIMENFAWTSTIAFVS